MKRIVLFAAMALVTLTGFAQPKFAHVNFSELVQLMPEADKAREAMTASQKEASDTFQAMYEEYQTKVQQYQQKAASWTPAIKESKEKELSDIQQRLEEFNQTIQQELQQQQQQLMAPIYQKAQEAVTTLAKAGNFIYVMDQGSFLYFDPAQSVDLTPDARKALNIPEGRTLESLQQELQAQAEAQAAAAK